MDAQGAVVFDKAQLAEAVHKKTDARPRRADHLRQRLLADLRDYRLRLAFFPEPGEQQQGPRQALLAGIKELIDQIFLNAKIAGQQISNKKSENLF